MSKPYRVAIIGCGRPLRTAGATGFGQSHVHIQGYQASGRCHLAALADISRENADAFATEHGDPKQPPAIYLDYRDMLTQERPDVVSICTWPHLHAPMVIACAEAGVRAVHCEKPMAPTWGEARRMAQACAEHGTQLTFNHQRRFEAPYRAAHRLLHEGVIGDLVRMEAHCGDLLDWGTHWFDMLFFYHDEMPVRWVLAQIDVQTERKVFGVPVETQAISFFQYSSGVYGLLITGRDSSIGCANRLIGTEGVIEVHPELPEGQRVPVRVRGRGDGTWVVPDISADRLDRPGNSVAHGIADLLDALEDGHEPKLSAQRALRATELIFASYESSRRRGRVDLPLTIDDSPLLTMLEWDDFTGRPPAATPT
ncbi:MAG: Gfo/Idh/MocA family oxidoreductase [Chloroflexi bacterium]|nr:Gfo/Idh/MocA family oxidoreductase [Chloroflexota bacterium]